jgi:hypothetical protein
MASMEFQVIRAETGLSSRGFSNKQRRRTLSLEVVPHGRGELNFSDGNRLLACDLSELWGKGLEVKKMYRGAFDGHGTWPLPVTVRFTTESREHHHFLVENDSADGFAQYENGEFYHGLTVWVFITDAELSALVEMNFDSPSRIFCDFSIWGLDDVPPIYESKDVFGSWNLSDDQHWTGKGAQRLISNFRLRRETAYFLPDEAQEADKAAMAEARQTLQNLQDQVKALVALGSGHRRGVVLDWLEPIFWVSLAAALLLAIMVAMVGCHLFMR